MTEKRRVLRLLAPQKSLRAQAQEAVRRAILELRFQPGQRLVERTLGAELGVSRTVVREVLRFLEAEGLIEISRNRGPVVATIKPDDVEQIYELRGLLEGSAAAACARLAETADIAELERAMRDLREASAKDDPRLSIRATNKFYERMFATSRKSVAWSVVETLNLRINALRTMTTRTPGRQQVALREMEKIFRAIGAGDAKTARAAAIEHVEAAGAVARQLLAEQPPADRPGAAARHPKPAAAD